MEDQSEPTAVSKTLTDEVFRLRNLIMKGEKLLFGERPKDKEATASSSKVKGLVAAIRESKEIMLKINTELEGI